MNFISKKIFVYALLAATAFAVYLPVLNNDFINLDDEDYVTKNSIVQEGLTVEGFKWAFTTGHASNWHPLTWLSHMLDCQLFDVDPGMHHLTSLLFHIFNTLLLLYLLHYATGSFWPSVLVSVLFALHPLHVESVAWVSERKDVLSSFFFFLTLIAYVRYSKQRSVIAYAAMLCMFALGLMSKPMLVTVPFVLLLLDYWPLERLQAERSSFVKLVVEKLPLFAMSIASCVVTFVVQRNNAVSSFAKISMLERMSNAIVSYKEYLYKMVLPKDLAVLYPHSSETIALLNILFSVLVLILLIGSAVKYRKRRFILTGLFWYLGMLVPVIGVIQVGIQSMADRYTYLPLIGIFIVIAWLLNDLMPKQPKFKIVLNALILISVGLMARGTYIQAGYWKDSFKLYNHSISVTEDNYMLHYSLGNALYSIGDSHGAIKKYEEVIDMFPKFAQSYYNIGYILKAEGKVDQAFAYYQKAIEVDPESADAYNNIGNIYLARGDISQAGSYYEKALSFNPGHVHANYDLAIVRKRQGNFEEAIKYHQKALEFDPVFIRSYVELAKLYVSMGQPQQGFSYLYKAIEFEPGDIELRFQLAKMLLQQKMTAEAAGQFEIITQQAPTWTEALNYLAWILATTGDKEVSDPSKAVRLAETLCKLSNYQHAGYLDTLAVAYASAGRFDDAIKIARKALDAARSSNRADLVREISSHIALFETRKPYVSP